MVRQTDVDFSTPNGILAEIQKSVNDFKADVRRHDEIELRLRGCNSAIKIHALNHMKEKLEYYQAVQEEHLLEND